MDRTTTVQLAKKLASVLRADADRIDAAAKRLSEGDETAWQHLEGDLEDYASEFDWLKDAMKAERG
jgi:methionine synthase II (cobalamin-independent)